MTNLSNEQFLRGVVAGTKATPRTYNGGIAQGIAGGLGLGAGIAAIVAWAGEPEGAAFWILMAMVLVQTAVLVVTLRRRRRILSEVAN